jgi:hypothetical protein
MKRSKKGVITPYPVATVFFLVVLLVFLVITPAISDIIKNAGKDQKCAVSSILEHGTKVGGFPLVESACPYDNEIVTKRDIERQTSKADAIIDEWNEQYKNTPYIYTEEDPQIWNLNKFIATEMRQCWSKLGAGERDLFSNWATAFGKDTEIEAIVDWSLLRPPQFCIPCSHILFDEEVRKHVYKQHPGGRIDSLTEWLGNNEVPLSGGQSYLEYLEDDIHTGIFGQTAYRYTLAPPTEADQAVGVVYVQKNVWQGIIIGETVLNFIGLETQRSTPTHSLELIPWADMSQVCDNIEE